MRRTRRRKCLCCGKLFRADARNRSRQKYCPKEACREASKAASQRRWLEKPENQNYFSGPLHVGRVRAWRAMHPLYWRRRGAGRAAALQDPCPGQELIGCGFSLLSVTRSLARPRACTDWLNRPIHRQPVTRRHRQDHPAAATTRARHLWAGGGAMTIKRVLCPERLRRIPASSAGSISGWCVSTTSSAAIPRRSRCICCWSRSPMRRA